MNATKLIIYPSNYYTSGVTIDVVNNFSIPITYQVSDVKTINTRNSTFSKAFKIAGTKEVNQIFDNIYDITNETQFNANKKTLCHIQQNGTSVLNGYLQLKGIEQDLVNQIKYYEVVVYSSTENLARELSLVTLNDLDLSSYNHTYSSNTIVSSWSATTDNGGIVFPLIDYGKNWTYNYMNGIYGELKSGDFFCSIYAKNIVDAIFKHAGYTYTSNFLSNDEIFRRVIMPLTEYKLPKEVTELHKMRAVKTSNQPFPTVGAGGQGHQEIIAFQNDTPNDGWDYSNSYNTSTYEYTFDNAYRAILSCRLFIDSNVDVVFNVRFWKIDAITSAVSLAWSSGILVNYQGTNTHNIESPPVDFQTGDKVYVEIESLFINVLAGSFFEVKITDDIIIGTNIDIATLIPRNIKAVDFLSSIFRTWNLYLEPDKNIGRNLIIEPRNEFYSQSEILDWTDKLDISKPFEQTILPELQAKNIKLSWSEDSDYFNTFYKGKTNKVYGDQLIYIDNDFLKEDSTLNIQPLFASTVCVKVKASDIVIPKIFKADEFGVTKKHENIKPRLLIYGGLIPCQQIRIDGNYYTSYPYAGHLDSYINPTFDLNFGTPELLFFSLSGSETFNELSYTNQNLYNNYWEDTIEEVTHKDSRLVTCYINLNPLDINNLSFRKSIKIRDGIFKLNKIINYNPISNSTTKVELIKSITSIPVVRGKFRRYTTGQIETDSVSSRLNIGSNNNINDPHNIAVGHNLNLGSGNEGNIVIGNDNHLYDSSHNVLMSGMYNSASTNNGFTIGGSGNSILLQSMNAGILAGFDNEIISSGQTNSVMIGGQQNIIAGVSDNFIIGGKSNWINSGNSYSNVIFGGSGNTIKQDIHNSTIRGGLDNSINGHYCEIQNAANSHIYGGQANTINNGRDITIGTPELGGSAGNFNTIINGNDSMIMAGVSYATIVNGNGITANTSNTSYVDYLNIRNAPLGGKYFLTWDNTTGRVYYQVGVTSSGSTSGDSIFQNITGSYHTIVPQESSTYISTGNPKRSFIANGYQNYFNHISGEYNCRYNVITNGKQNKILDGSYMSIFNGKTNYIIGTDKLYSTILNGANNVLEGNFMTIGNGLRNTIYSQSDFSTIMNGVENVVQTYSKYSFVNGKSNIIYNNNYSCLINSGTYNRIKSYTSFNSILNGKSNTIEAETSYYNTILNGQNNTINPGISNSAILNGSGMTAVESNTAYVDYMNIRTAPAGGELMLTWDSTSGKVYSANIPTGGTSTATLLGNGLNTYTGGTASNPNVNISALTINSLSVSGSSSFNSISATTIYSGSTDLSLLFGSGSGVQTSIQNGLNTYTGGTSSAPTVNISALTINSLSVSGNASFSSISATTYYSGTTLLSSVLNGLPKTNVQNGLNTYTGGTALAPTVNISAATLSSLSSTTVSGGTIFSGSTNLNSLFQHAGRYLPGMMVLLYNTETEVSSTTGNLSAVTWTYSGAAIYSKYKIEADVKWTQVANTNNETQFQLWYESSSFPVESLSLRADATGAGDQSKLAGHLSYVIDTTFLFKYGVAVTQTTGAPTWSISNFRVYGII